MKKKYYLIVLCLIAFAGCKKSGHSPKTPAPLIDYEFSTTVNDTYAISYLDENHNMVDITITGTSWSKVFTVADTANFKNASVSVGSATGTLNTTGVLSLAVNKQVKVKSNFIFTSVAPVATASYVMGL